jgi:hypothetical protein
VRYSRRVLSDILTPIPSVRFLCELATPPSASFLVSDRACQAFAGDLLGAM